MTPELQALLETIDPHLRAEVEVALDAKKVLDESIPADMAAWGMDRWAKTNRRQYEAVDRLLAKWRVLRSDADTLLEACKSYDNVLRVVLGEIDVADVLKAKWVGLDSVPPIRENSPR
jgi:hypothetical protein